MMVLKSLAMQQNVCLVPLNVPFDDIYCFTAHNHSFNISTSHIYDKSGISSKCLKQITKNPQIFLLTLLKIIQWELWVSDLKIIRANQ